MNAYEYKSSDPAAVTPKSPPYIQAGPIRLPVPGALPPLANKIDYEALRQRRMAEVDEETHHINLPFGTLPAGFTPAPPADPHVLAPGLKAWNVEVPGPAGPLPMRIYMPENRTGPIGLYLHTHGGGWAGFDGLEACDTENSGYALAFGCAVAQLDHRTSWKAKFPAQVEDCFAAYNYILEKGDELGIDKTKIGIGGGCTGANIATVVSLMARDAEIQKPSVQWLWTPVFDTRNNTRSYEEFANYAAHPRYGRVGDSPLSAFEGRHLRLARLTAAGANPRRDSRRRSYGRASGKCCATSPAPTRRACAKRAWTSPILKGPSNRTPAFTRSTGRRANPRATLKRRCRKSTRSCAATSARPPRAALRAGTALNGSAEPFSRASADRRRRWHTEGAAQSPKGDIVIPRVSCQVLIVGFGPVGATLAGLLADSGLDVLAIDKSTEVYPLPRAGHFDHEVMRVFQQLGVAEAVLPHTHVPYCYEFRNGKGEVLYSQTSEEGQLASSGWASSYMFNQPGLERALRQKIAASPSLDIRLGVEFRSMRTSAAGVEASLATPAGDLMVEADYVVGCDGASSPVREAVGVKLIDLEFEEPWLVIDALPRPGSQLPRKNLQICDPARPTTCIPLGPGKHRWEFMMKPGETAEQVLDDAFIHELLGSWDADVEIERKAVYRFHGLVADRWRKGRVLIAGDAAHQMPPFAGQGMCSGIRDAANLSWKLADILNGRATEGLLDTYQIEREPNVRAYVELSMAMGRVVCVLDPEAARARDEQMIAARSAGTHKLSPPELPPFTGPGIVAGAAGAGEIFPQPTHREGERTVRLDDVLGPGPWLISRFAESPASAPHINAVAIDDPRLAPFRTGLEDWLAAHSADAVLVRPDRYVFGAGQPAGLLAAWMRALGAPAAMEARP